MENLARVATDGEIAAMQEVVRREAGLTLGLSTGLVYNPAVYCDQREITALVRAFNEVKPGALFPHLRSESDNIVASLKEVVEAAIDGGGGYCNEHSKIAGARNYAAMTQLEDILADAGSLIPTMENMYPYTAGSTTGDAIFPPEMRAGSRAEFLARLRDPSKRRAMADKMRHDTKSWDNFVAFCGGLQGIQIAGVKPGVGDRYLGLRLADVARAAGAADPNGEAAYEAVFDFFAENDGEIAIITHYGNDATVERFFRRPNMAICTDGLMPGPGQKPHPRALGAFPKALRMGREMGIPLAQMIWRMATLPCRFLNLPDPTLKIGADASLVLFDPATVGERNDYIDPLSRPRRHRHGLGARRACARPRHIDRAGRVSWTHPDQSAQSGVIKRRRQKRQGQRQAEAIGTPTPAVDSDQSRFYWWANKDKTGHWIIVVSLPFLKWRRQQVHDKLGSAR